MVFGWKEPLKTKKGNQEMKTDPCPELRDKCKEVVEGYNHVLDYAILYLLKNCNGEVGDYYVWKDGIIIRRIWDSFSPFYRPVIFFGNGALIWDMFGVSRHVWLCYDADGLTNVINYCEQEENGLLNIIQYAHDSVYGSKN